MTKNPDADVWNRVTDILSKPEHYGHSTYRLGNMLSMPTASMRKVLDKMEQHGLVARNARLSRHDNTYWELKP